MRQKRVKVNQILLNLEDERNTNRKNVDRSENGMDLSKVEVSEGKSDNPQEDERNMIRNVNRSENEIDSNYVEVCERELDTTQEYEKNTEIKIDDISKNDEKLKKVE